MSHRDKVALVTGASRGIGQAVAFALGREGTTVIGTATTQQGADNITTAFKNAEIKGCGMVLNVADPASIETAITAIKEQYAMPSILINNAAITQDNLFLRMKEEEWDRVIETNLHSLYRVTKACVKDMLKNRWGRIVSMGSIVGTTGNRIDSNIA